MGGVVKRRRDFQAGWTQDTALHWRLVGLTGAVEMTLRFFPDLSILSSAFWNISCGQDLYPGWVFWHTLTSVNDCWMSTVERRESGCFRNGAGRGPGPGGASAGAVWGCMLCVGWYCVLAWQRKSFFFFKIRIPQYQKIVSLAHFSFLSVSSVPCMYMVSLYNTVPHRNWFLFSRIFYLTVGSLGNN